MHKSLKNAVVNELSEKSFRHHLEHTLNFYDIFYKVIPQISLSMLIKETFALSGNLFLCNGYVMDRKIYCM